MSESQQGLPQPEVSGDERLRSSILQRAASFMRSTQNPPEWPGAQFIKPKDTRVFSEIDSRFSQILTEFEVDAHGGVMVDGTSLDHAVFDHSKDPNAKDAVKAQESGFWAGAKEALDWMGVTKNKWSSQPADICALEALAAAEGLPTSRQCNCSNPDRFVGAKTNNLLKTFKYGETNGILKSDKGSVYLGLAPKKLHKELTLGYRKGVETAFLHYVVAGSQRVRISQIEQLSNAFSNR